MSTSTKRNMPFDAPELAWQRHRYTSRLTPPPADDGSATTSVDYYDESLFDNAYSSDSGSDSDSGYGTNTDATTNPISAARADPIFDEGAPHLPTDPFIACKRHKEIFYNALRMLSKLEDIKATIEYLAWTAPDHPHAKDPFVSTSDHEIRDIISDLTSRGAFAALRPTDALFSDIETSEKFMERWTHPLAIEYISKDMVSFTDRALHHLNSLGITADCVRAGLMVERSLLQQVMHDAPFSTSEGWLYLSAKVKTRKVLEDLEDRGVEIGGLRGKIFEDTDDELYWDINEKETFRNRGTWLESILADVRVHRVSVRTKLIKGDV
jgi:hypothetical protein